ncbi:unnamed protein product, partial [Closterium sp. NIES-54]
MPPRPTACLLAPLRWSPCSSPCHPPCPHSALASPHASHHTFPHASPAHPPGGPDAMRCAYLFLYSPFPLAQGTHSCPTIFPHFPFNTYNPPSPLFPHPPYSPTPLIPPPPLFPHPQVGNRSSEFHPDVRHVRRHGSYIYEEFLPTGGTDVKVYTVGPDYAHAEARKSPVVDGVVMRSADGKEIRYPVLLTPTEKEMARVICLAFGQAVCGFDLLRSHGRSFVCDVNGWSFVKNSS